MKVRILTPLLTLAISSVGMAQYNYYSAASATMGTPWSVSNNGVAVGVASSQIAMWQPSVNATPTLIGGLTSNTPRISANGMFVAANSAGPDGKSEMSRYSVASGTWTPLGGAGGYSGTTRSSSWGISGDGSTVVGFGYGPYTGAGTGTYTGIHPISVKGGVTTNYSIVPAASSINRIQAANWDGSVVAGQMRYTTSLSGSFYWNNGTRHDMMYNGLYLGSPEAMSSDGTIIAGSGSSTTPGTFNGISHRLPYIYNTTTGITTVINSIAGLNGNAILNQTGARVDGFVTGLSGDGTIAVGFFRQMAPSVYIDKTWGFIWTAETGAVTFDSFCASNGIAAAANNYMIPTGVSANGLTFSGYTMVKSGTPAGTSFVMTPVPEPSSIAALGLGAIALIRRRKKSN